MANNIGASIAEALHAQATWRRRKDGQYADPRSAQWADAADAAADYAAALPERDPLLIRIARHSMLESTGVVSFGEQSAGFASRSTLGPEAFLTELADLMELENNTL